MIHPKIGCVLRAACARSGLLRLLACGALLGTALSGLAGSAVAADSTWIGGTSGDYNDPANWSNGVPTGGQTGLFGASPPITIDVGASGVGWTFKADARDYVFAHTSGLMTFNGAGIVVVGGSATINNDATLAFQVNSSAGGATINNDASLNFDGNSNAGSATINNDASVFFNNSSSAGSATITNITNISALNFTGSSNAGSARLINNAGAIDFALSTGANGDSRLTAGSIEGAGTFALGTRELTTGNNLNTSVSGAITGTGTVTGVSLVKVGAGTLTLTGTTKAYTGATNVNAGTLLVSTGLATSGISVGSGGTLVVNSALTGTGVTIGSGGRLGGSGTVGTTVLNGVIAPGNSIGTINTGPITFGVGSRYEVEISPTQSDRTNVIGTASLAGTVQVIAGAGTYTAGTAYTILTSTGGRSGTFSSVTDNLAFFTPVLSYDANNVYLTLTQTVPDYQVFGTTSNRQAVGGSLGALGASAPYFAQLQTLTDADVPVALDALSGEAHAAIKGEFLAQSQMLADAAFGRIDQSASAVDTTGAANGYVASDALPAAKAGTELWGNLYGSMGVIRANGNAAETTSATGGVLLGHDVELASGWTMGVLAGAGLTAINARSTSANSADFSLGLYGGSKLGVVDVKLGAAYTRHQINSRRTITFGGVNEVMTANYAANTLQGFTEISHTFDYGAIDLTPFARLDLVTNATDAFTETGGAGALSSAASRNNAAFTTLGLRLADSFVAGETMLVRAEGGLGWRHAFADLPSTTNSFSGGTPFTVSGSPVASDALALNASLGFDVSDSLNLALSYDGQLSTGGASHTIKLAAAGTF